MNGNPVNFATKSAPRRCLLGFLVLLCSFSSITQAQLLPDKRKGEWHVLLIAATADPLAGQANMASMLQASQNLELIASTLGIKLYTYRVTGEAFTLEGVKKGIRDLLTKERPEEGKMMATVMSFTHGMNYPDTWTRLPFMVCHPTENRLQDKNNLLAIEDIYQTLRTFGDYDHLHVWAELCNNVPYGLEGSAPSSRLFNHLMPNKQSTFAKHRLEQLLMGEKSVVMVSSKYGQVSYTFKNGGGVFTNSLFMGLEKVANGDLASQYEGENGLFSFVKTQTQQQVTLLAGSFRRQTPQCYVGEVPTRAPRPNSYIVQVNESVNYKNQSSGANKSKAKSPMDILKEVWPPKN